MMKRKHTLGFSLLELSLVIGIISLIAGAGMSMAVSALKTADRIATQEKLNTIKLALDSHAKTYGFLPCPGNRTLAPSNASFGVEARTAPAAACNISAPGVTGVLTNTVIIGMVPVRTLGLPDNYASDAWGNKFTYAVSSTMIGNAASYATQAPVLTVRYGDRTTYYNVTQQRMSLAYTAVADNGSGKARMTVASTTDVTVGDIIHFKGTAYTGSYAASAKTGTTIDFSTLTYTTTDTGTIEWLKGGSSASYVVVSHGVDGRGAYPTLGSTIPTNKPCTGTTIDVENCNDTDEIFYDTLFNDNPDTNLAAQYFDDYIVWGSNAQQRTPVITNFYSQCPTTSPVTCENWCAKCSVNYPGGGTTAPPAGLTNPVLCKKVVTSNATTCTASCYWSGTTGTGYVKCP